MNNSARTVNKDSQPNNASQEVQHNSSRQVQLSIRDQTQMVNHAQVPNSNNQQHVASTKCSTIDSTNGKEGPEGDNNPPGIANTINENIIHRICNFYK